MQLSRQGWAYAVDPQPHLPGQVDAAIIDSPGAEPRLGSYSLPRVRPGHSRLQVMAAPLNPLDLAIASGSFHSVRHDSPYVPGSECVGVVVESHRFSTGELVYAEVHASPTTPGALATFVVVADDDIVPVPAGIDPVRAAAVGNAGTAAYMPLVDVAAMRAGDTVLVLGATGSVGKIAVQVASLKGAGRVVGLARDRDALEDLLAIGADAVVDLRGGEGVDKLAARILAEAGPVDVVLDGIYGPPLEAALLACTRGARIVNVGNGAGPTAQVPAGLLRGKQLTLSGFAGLHTTLSEKRPALNWLWAALISGDLRVQARQVPLQGLPDAWREQASSTHAKWVVCPQEGRIPPSSPSGPIVAAPHDEST